MAAVGRFHAGHNGFFLRSLCPLRTYKFRQGYRQQRKRKKPLRTEGRNADCSSSFYSSSTRNLSCIRSRITNSVKAIVCATANTPASVQERNYPSLITLLIALSHKLNRAISAPASKAVHKNAYRFYKMQPFFCFKHYFAAIVYRNAAALPSAVSTPLAARFREKGGYLSEPLRHFYKIASVKVAVSNATEIRLFCFQAGRSSV